jgi:hypothetical protein
MGRVQLTNIYRAWTKSARIDPPDEKRGNIYTQATRRGEPQMKERADEVIEEQDWAAAIPVNEEAAG